MTTSTAAKPKATGATRRLADHLYELAVEGLEAAEESGDLGHVAFASAQAIAAVAVLDRGQVQRAITVAEATERGARCQIGRFHDAPNCPVCLVMVGLGLAQTNEVLSPTLHATGSLADYDPRFRD